MRARVILLAVAMVLVGYFLVRFMKTNVPVESKSGGVTSNAVAPRAPVVVVVPASSQQWQRVWMYPAGGSLAGAPAVLGDGWVVTTTKGRVLALDGAGHERWSRLFTNMTFAGSAAVAGEAVVVAGVDGNVAALGAAAGQTLWETSVPGTLRHGPVAVSRGRPGRRPEPGRPVGAFRHGPLAMQDGDAWRIALLASEDGVLRCLDAKDGKEVWHSEPTNRSDGPPNSDGRLIAYGNCDASIHLVDATNGTAVGAVSVGADAQMAGGVTFADGRVYGGTRAGELVCADTAALNLAWHVSVSGGEAFGTPVAARGLVVMGTPEGTVAAFDARTGAERWKVSASNAVSTLCVVDDAVFAAAGGSLLGLRLSDGVQFATLPVGDDIVGPASNDRVLAVADDGGNVIALTGK